MKTLVKWFIIIISFIALNFIALIWFHDELISDVDGKYSGFTKEELFVEIK